MSKIIVSMSGWCEADPARTMFQYIGRDDNAKQYIAGTEWLKLPEYHEKELCREDYILESIASAFVTALDCEYDSVDIEVEDD